jgi:hypothetical protein
VVDSKRIAGIVGPVLVAIILTENPFVNPHLYDDQIPPVVYLSGVLFFVAGLFTIRAHNRWSGGWPVLITLLGWLAAALGLVRMAVPHAYITNYAGQDGTVLATEAALLAVGIFLTFKAYSR